MATRQLMVALQDNNMLHAVGKKVDNVEQAQQALGLAKAAAIEELTTAAASQQHGVVDPNLVQNIRTMIESPTTHIAEMQRRTAHPKFNIEYLIRMGQQRDPATGERSQVFHNMLSKMRAEAKPELLRVVLNERYINIYLNQQHVDGNAHLYAAFKRYHQSAQGGQRGPTPGATQQRQNKECQNMKTTTTGNIQLDGNHDNINDSRKKTQAEHGEPTTHNVHSLNKPQHSAKRAKIPPNAIAMITHDICNTFDNNNNAVGFTRGSPLQQTILTLWVVMIIRCIAAIPPNIFLPNKNTHI